MTYIQGFVLAVPTGRKEDYVEMAKKGWAIFKDYGALSMCEAWGDDVPDGEVTSFPMAVKKAEDETVVFSWIVWPDREACDRCGQSMEMDERWKEFSPETSPFDMKRMIYGGFVPVYEAA